MNIARQYRPAMVRIVSAAERGEAVLVTWEEALGLFACLGSLSGILQAEAEHGEDTINDILKNAIERMTESFHDRGFIGTGTCPTCEDDEETRH